MATMCGDCDGWQQQQRRRRQREGARPNDGAVGDEGWAGGARVRRRTGTADANGHGGWVGFAGLGQTTVERLLRQGSDGGEDERASAPLTPAACQATPRHVWGGECDDAGEDARAACALAAEQLRGMLRTVAMAGGRASSLMGPSSRMYVAYLASFSTQRSCSVVIFTRRRSASGIAGVKALGPMSRAMAEPVPSVGLCVY